MNEQKAMSQSHIEWTRVINPDGTRRRGFTWNPIGGCKHDCKWIMPNGQVAQCYAKTVAEGVARNAYPDGFEEHYYHDKRLREPDRVKEPAGIFLDSMSDLAGHWVPEKQVENVLDVCQRNPHHIFQLLTKNAPRLVQFDFPDNVWVGVSSPPDFMWGQRLDAKQQDKMLDFALRTLMRVDVPVTWTSFEPLSRDYSEIVARYPGALDWAVIGAASDGPKEYPPDETHLRNLLDVLDDQGVPVFFKGNLRSLSYADANWRENFPGFSVPPTDVPVPKQLGLFD